MTYWARVTGKSSLRERLALLVEKVLERRRPAWHFAAVGDAEPATLAAARCSRDVAEI